MGTYSSEHITIGQHKFIVDTCYDEDMGAPWVEHDEHGSIRSVSSRYGRPDKKPGEVMIYQDRGEYWFYDVQSTIKTARADGWGICGDTSGMTRRQVTAAAVAKDMQYCRRYLDGYWHWCGIVVTLLDSDGEKTDTQESLWGMESDDIEGMDSESRALAGYMVDELRKQWRVALHEARTRRHWACRDVVTVGASH